ELNSGIGAISFDICRAECPDGNNKKVWQSLTFEHFSPAKNRVQRVRQQIESINKQQRSTPHADVSRIAKRREKGLDEGQIVVRRVLLCKQHFALAAVPPPSPIFICPTNTESNV